MNEEDHRRRNMELYRRAKAREEAAANPKPPPQPAMTRAQRLSREKVFRFFAEDSLNDQRTLEFTLREEVPEAWHTLEYDLDVVEDKVKVTLWLDKSVAQFYRGMGKGYQARINRILALYAHMKIAKFIDVEKAMKEKWGLV